MDLDPQTLLLQRHLGDVTERRILVVDSPAGEVGPVLVRESPGSAITLWQTDWSDYLRLDGSSDQRRLDCVFSAWHQCESPCDVIILHLPKSRPLLEMMLANAVLNLAPGGRLLLVGPLKGGIRSAVRLLERRFGAVEKLGAARHCALYSAVEPKPVSRTSLEDWFAEYDCVVGERSVPVASLPGVFSHGRLDDGTRLLLETLKLRTRARLDGVLDFGCGCGIIGSWVHALEPEARIDMVDSSAFALESARRTARINALPEDCVQASAGFSAVHTRFGLIISNPPFHTGFGTDHSVAEQFLQGIPSRLVPNGVLRLVASRFLKYPELVERYIGPLRIVAEDGRYRVYEAVNRPAGNRKGRPRRAPR